MHEGISVKKRLQLRSFVNKRIEVYEELIEVLQRQLRNRHHQEKEPLCWSYEVWFSKSSEIWPRDLWIETKSTCFRCPPWIHTFYGEKKSRHNSHALPILPFCTIYRFIFLFLPRVKGNARTQNMVVGDESSSLNPTVISTYALSTRFRWSDNMLAYAYCR